MAIASCLVDTNILLRITRRSDPQHKVVDTALARLAGQGSTLHYTHQNIAELWNAMTRPVARNGLGLTAAEAERQVRAIEFLTAKLCAAFALWAFSSTVKALAVMRSGAIHKQEERSPSLITAGISPRAHSARSFARQELKCDHF